MQVVAYGKKVQMDARPMPSDKLYPWRVTCSLCPGLSLPAENMTAANAAKGSHRRDHWLSVEETP